MNTNDDSMTDKLEFVGKNNLGHDCSWLKFERSDEKIGISIAESWATLDQEIDREQTIALRDWLTRAIGDNAPTDHSDLVND